MKFKTQDGAEFESDTPEKLIEAVALPPLAETGKTAANFIYLITRKLNNKADMARLMDEKSLEFYGQLLDVHSEQLILLFSQMFDRVRDEYIKIPETRRIEPLALPVCNEMLRFAEDSYDNPDLQDLQEYYANLVAANFDADRAQSKHPAFRQIITQITPDEARFFKALCDRVCRPQYTEFRYEPLVDIAVQQYNKPGEFIAFRNICLIGIEAQCVYPERTPTYIDNLNRLQLIEIRQNEQLVETERYSHIIESGYYQGLIEEIRKNGHAFQPEPVPHMIGVTDFGRDFMNACFR